MPTQISAAAALRRLISPRVVEAATNLRTGEFDRLSSDVLVVGDAIRALDIALSRGEFEGLDWSAAAPNVSPETIFPTKPVALFSAADGELEPIAEVLVPLTDRPAVAILWDTRVFVRGPGMPNYEEVLAVVGSTPEAWQSKNPELKSR